MSEQWFCFDGCSFELFATKEEAARHATRSVDEWFDEAGGEGLSELAEQVCYGRVTHVVEMRPTGFGFVEMGSSQIATFQQVRDALEDANQLCRSAYQIALRNGERTNWDGYRKALGESLARQHRVMFPHVAKLEQSNDQSNPNSGNEAADQRDPAE